jgi:adenine specific DNA methylase Mod
MSTVDKPSKIREKESDMPDSIDNKNASSKDNSNAVSMNLEEDLSDNRNDLDTLDEKKADPFAGKGVDKIEEKDKSNKHVDKQKKKESKKVTPSPSPYTFDIFSYKKHSMDYFTVNGVILSVTDCN